MAINDIDLTTNKDDKNKKVRLKQKIDELSSASSIHGYSNIFRANHLATKIMWFFSFLLSTGFCGFMVYRIITEYNHYKDTDIFRYKFYLPLCWLIHPLVI